LIRLGGSRIPITGSNPAGGRPRGFFFCPTGIVFAMVLRPSQLATGYDRNTGGEYHLYYNPTLTRCTVDGFTPNCSALLRTPR
jgi:hypothetical protein